MNNFILNKKVLLVLAAITVLFFMFFLYKILSSFSKPSPTTTTSTTLAKNEVIKISEGIPYNKEEREVSEWKNVPNPEELDLLTRTEYGGEVVGISYIKTGINKEVYARVELALEGAPFSPFFYYKTNSLGEWENIEESLIPKQIKTALEK